MYVVISRWLVASLLLVLSGCATFSPKIDQATLKDQGILVGQVLGTWGDGFTGSIRIGRRSYPIKNGMFAIPLDPGEYEIRAFKTVGAGSYSVSPVRGVSSVSTRRTTTYPFAKKVRITKGAITSAGTIYILFEGKGKKFRIFLIDNIAELKTYLRTEHPKIAPRLDRMAVHNADWQFLTPAQLKKVRQYLAINKRGTKSLGHGFYRAPLGTVALMYRDRQKKVRIHVFDTGSTRLGACNAAARRFACIRPDWDGTKLMVRDRAGIALRPLPALTGRHWLSLAGKKEIQIVDDRFTIHSSYDGGQTWGSDTRFRLSDSLEYPGRIQISRGAKGVYINANSETKTLVYKPDGARRFEPIPADEAVTGEVNEIDGGLFVGPEWSLFSKSELSYRDSASGQWSKHSLPARECRWIHVVNRRAGELILGCSAFRYLSKDKGKTWTEITKAQASKLIQISHARH